MVTAKAKMAVSLARTNGLWKDAESFRWTAVENTYSQDSEHQETLQ